MVQVFTLTQIKDVLKTVDPFTIIEEGFIAYSRGKVVVPPVGELIFKDPPGDVHIKYGYIIDDESYVIKIASGFPENRRMNLPAGNGIMLMFNQKTGEPICILLDEGYLTDVRTAAAGAVVAKHLAPQDVHRIGILGAGIQGRMQLEYLKHIISCEDVIVWDINRQNLDEYKQDMEMFGFKIQIALDADEVASTCNFIVTATPSTTPLLDANQVREGTHITAMGSDTPEKNELDPKILQKADVVVADSIDQCLIRGEIHHALKAGLISKDCLVELGSVAVDEDQGRLSDEQVTVADLTGVAVQDIQITKAVYKALIKG